MKIFKFVFLIFVFLLMSCRREQQSLIIEEFVEEEVVQSYSFEKFSFPLPEKYKNNVSSKQGLRGSIKNVNTGVTKSSTTYHNAVDYAVPIGTPVFAAKSGYVTTVYPSLWNRSQWKGHPTYSGMIEIKHLDDTTTLYAHLVLIEVRENEFVERGQRIGASGGEYGKRGSGSSTGPHLHFAVFVDIDSIWD